MEKKPLSALERKVIEGFGKFVGGAQVKLYRATAGRLGGKFMFGAPVLLLTTQGRRTGKARTSPLLYLRDGERLLVVASKGGFPSHPAWYLNLRETPEVQVQVGAELRTMRAATLDDEERARFWPELVKLYPPYADYQTRTDRKIPIVRLTPVDG